MKRSVLCSLIAAAALTSACGKDSKKSETKSTVFHTVATEGLCVEVVQEQLAAKGFGVPDEFTSGNCPQQTVLQGSISASRYAACPMTFDNGAPGTAVFYSKMIDDEGDVLDLTALSPQFICQNFLDGQE
jgi:hypothetical protein